MYRAMRPVPKNPIRCGRPCPRPRLSQSAAAAADAAVLEALTDACLDPVALHLNPGNPEFRL